MEALGTTGIVAARLRHRHFPAGGEDHRHLQQETKAQTTIDFNFIFSFLDLVLSPFQIYLISVFSLPSVLDLAVVVRGH